MNALKRHRWWLLVGALAVFVIATLLSKDESDELVLWHAYDEGEARALRAVLDLYEEEHGVAVRDVRLPFGVLASRLESAVRTGNGPDLFIDAHERLGRYIEAGIVQPLEEEHARPSVTDALEPSHVEALRRDDALFGLPLSAKALALYINRSLVPDTDEGTLDERLREEFPEGVWPLVTEAENAYYVAPFFHAFGTRLYDTEAASRGESGFAAATDEGAEALARLDSFFRAGAIPAEPSGELVARLFGDGQAAYAISGPWLQASLPAGSLSYKVQRLPALDGAGAMQPYVTIEAVMRAARSSHEHAGELAEFLATGEGAYIRLSRGDQVVSDQGAWTRRAEDSAGLIRRPVGYHELNAFREAARTGVVMPSDPNMSQVFEPMTRAIRDVVRGGADPRAALDDAKQRFERSVEALPEPRDPTPALVVVSLLLLFLVYRMLQQSRDPAFRSRLRASRYPYRYVAVAGVAVLLLVIGPLLVGALMSVFATNGIEFRYVGLTNYLSILSNDGQGLLANGSFWRVLLVTLLWTVLNLVLHVGIGVALALALHRPTLKLRALYRVLLIVPWAVPNYVTALSWKGMFHSQYGAINGMIEAAGGDSIQWFSRFATAFAANLTTNVWLGFPFMMVVALGALSAIPRELYDAATVDGATPWQRFRFVTWPMLWPVMIPAIAMGAVWTFNMFNVVFLVSGGEPGGSTEILVSEAYRWAFTRGARYGYAAAYAVLIFGVLWLGTQHRSVRKALQ